MSNAPDYVAALYGCWHAGLIAVPINAKLHPKEVAHILADCAAALLVVSPDLTAAANEAVANSGAACTVIDTGSADWRQLCAEERIEPCPRAPTDAAWLFYTSGTTGRPKGAILSHRNLLTMSATYLSDVDPATPFDCILHAAPMSHGSGLYILPHVSAMALHVIPQSKHFEPAEIFALMASHPGMSFFAAPTMVQRLVTAPEAGSADTRNLKTIIYGGGPMYVKDCKAALALFGYKLAQIYGQGESPMTITVLPKHAHADIHHPRYEQRLASVGYAQSAVEVVVADGEDRALPPGETGEVLVRGDTVMSGYWNLPQETTNALRGGWLHTGDVGTLEGDGYLTLLDRSKDLVISGGTNIYPREVEEVLLLHPSVAAVSIVGRPHPEWGEELLAFVVLQPGAARDPASLDAFCTQHIARFKRPKAYRFVAELPKNAYGKVLKTELRRAAMQPDPDEARMGA